MRYLALVLPFLAAACSADTVSQSSVKEKVGSGGTEGGANPPTLGPATPPPVPCDTPTIESGIFACKGEFSDATQVRQRAEACNSKQHRAELIDVEEVCASPGADCCDYDSDCEEGWYCTIDRSASTGPVTRCAPYICTDDSDCEEGQICDCITPDYIERGGTCVEAECSDSSDCAAGMHCAYKGSKELYCGLTNRSYRCETLEDECSSDADCAANEGATCAIEDGFPNACVVMSDECFASVDGQ